MKVLLKQSYLTDKARIFTLVDLRNPPTVIFRKVYKNRILISKNYFYILSTDSK